MLTKRHASTSLIALASLFWLAGAKADGCTGSVTPEEPTIPTGSECAPGTHLESFCDPAVLGGGAADPGMPGVAGAPGGNCHDECVPDGGLCPPGFGEQWVCEGWAEGGVPGEPPAPPDCDPNYGACPPPPPPCDPANGDCPPPPPPPCDPANGDCPPPPPPPCDPANGDCPPPPACHLECVPLDPCGPGFHAEYQCGGGEPVPMGEPGQPPPPPPAGTAGSDPGQVPPAPPDDCGFVCMPDSICPDGMYETLVCTGAVEPGDPGLPPDPGDPNLPPDPGVCYTQCMPLCPEGTVGETVCTDSPDPGFPGTCFVQCIPIDLCPPGTVEQTVCDPSAPPPPQEGAPDLPPPPPPCWTECVPEPTCPPGEHVEPDCGNIDGGGGATPACVPVCVPDVLCDPTLVCGQALACFDGLLYPTICGPQNCDAPLGPCEAPAPLPMRIRR